jgi:hypothetical protein
MEKQSTFSVNKEFTNDELFELKKIIIGFIKERAESSIVCFYRPEEKTSKRGLIVGKECSVGEPEPQKLNELLDIVKSVEPSEDGKKPKVMIIVPLPI